LIQGGSNKCEVHLLHKSFHLHLFEKLSTTTVNNNRNIDNNWMDQTPASKKETNFTFCEHLHVLHLHTNDGLDNKLTKHAFKQMTLQLKHVEKDH